MSRLEKTVERLSRGHGTLTDQQIAAAALRAAEALQAECYGISINTSEATEAWYALAEALRRQTFDEKAWEEFPR